MLLKPRSLRRPEGLLRLKQGLSLCRDHYKLEIRDVFCGVAGVIGIWCNLAPIASKMAFAATAPTRIIAGSALLDPAA